MKSKEEIEKYLGIKIESSYEEQTRDSSYAMPPDQMRYVSKHQEYYTVTVKVLSKESEKALKDLLKDSMNKGDLETASTCHSVLMEESTYYRNHPNAIGLNFEQGIALSEYEEQQKAIAEEQARIKAEQEAKAREEEQARIKAEQEAKAREEEQSRIKAEQEAKAKAEEQARIKAEQEAKAKEEEQARIKAEQEAKAKEEEQARIKAEQEAKAKAEEQARIKAEQEAKAKAEEQARIKAEQEAKERQASIDKDIAEYQQYEELITRKPELDKLLEDLRYEDFSAEIHGTTSDKMQVLIDRVNSLPEDERKIIIQQYNRTANILLDEDGKVAGQEEKGKDIEVEQEQVVLEDVEEEPVILEEEKIIETGANIELDDESMMNAHLEYMANNQNQQTSQVVEDYWNEIHSQQQPEKIRPREKSVKDEVGDEVKTPETRMQTQEKQSVDLWMNRFNGWYSAIDRVSQSVKNKFVKMKSDIVKAISEKLKERTNLKQVNTQEQDTNER